ncbi:MAG: tetratricopeptide repeat protein [Bacteroidales bacterium]
MKKLLLPLCLLAASAGSTVFGQVSYTSSLPEALFTKGKEMYEVKNWDGCIDQLVRFKKETTNTDLLQESDYMIAASAFEKDKAYALPLLEQFRTDYPWSRHIEQVNFLIGSWHFLHASYSEAIDVLSPIDFERLPVDEQPVYFHRLGVSYLKMGNTKEAYPLFRVLSEMGSEYDDAANYYLAYIKYADKEYAQALKAFRALPESGEYAGSVPYYITQILFVQNNYDEAKRAALDLLSKKACTAEQRAELNRIAGESYFQTGEEMNAVKYLKRYVAETDRPLRSSAYILGIAAYRSGEYDTAISNLSRATNGSDELTQNAYLHLGHCYLQSGDTRNARMAFETASKGDYNKTVKEAALYNYGLTIHESSYSPFNESVVVFEQFLNEFPNSRYTDKVNDCLVEVYMTTRNYEAALNSINKIARPGQKIQAAKQRILFQLGTQSVANADLAGAEKCFTQAIALGNLNTETRAQALFWRGECYYRSGLYAKAESDFRQFLALTKDQKAEVYALGHYNLGYTCFKQHNFDGAIRSYSEYVAIPAERGKNSYGDALNRIGDSYFYKRQFGKAEEFYAQASAISPAAGDYALFQKGFMAGLQKNYTAKIQAMDKLLTNFPNSDYADDALSEKGKTYFQLGQTQKAIESFESLMARFPNTSAARQAGVQLGLIYFNGNQLEQSIVAYKRVIDNYPGSEEARTAAEDLKAVYIEKNDIPAYANYIQTLKGKVQFAAGEQDSLTYLAAEKVLMRGNSAESEKALFNYLQSFEQGAFRLNANVELARMFFQSKAYEKAVHHYEAILQAPDNKFTEESLARTAEIYFMEGESQKALETFRTLAIRAERKENKLAAKVGILRTTASLELSEEVVLAANDLLDNGVLTPELKHEAMYNRAKALLELKKNEYAMKDLKELSKDTRHVFGAEASYLLADHYFRVGKSDEAEAEVFRLIESSTPHQYWLARGFILLADIYIAKEDAFQAKQYLQSLQNNYKGNDEIAGMIQERFNKIGE